MNENTTAQAEARSVADFAERLFGACSSTLVSATNNSVWRIDTANRSLALKLIRDDGIDLKAALAFEECASVHRVRTPRTLLLDETRHMLPQRMLLQEFQSGESLADVFRERPALLKEFLPLSTRMIDACAQMDAPGGFGYLKNDRARHASVADFYRSTIDRYVERVASVSYFDADSLRAVAALLANRLLRACENHPETVVVPVDVNLRNFLVHDEGIVVLNVPLFAVTSRLHGFSSFVFQLRAIGAHESAVQYYRASGATNASEAEIAAFEALAVLGVLSFCSKGGARALHEATAWGSDTRLVDLLAETLQSADIHQPIREPV